MDLLDRLASSGMPRDVAKDVAEKINEGRKAITSLLIEETRHIIAIYVSLSFYISADW